MLGVLLVGCSATNGPQHNLVVCGQTVSRFIAGVTLTDVAVGGTAAIGPNFPGPATVRVSRSCSHGADVSVLPDGALSVTPLAVADDHRPVVVRVGKGSESHGILRIVRSPQPPIEVTVDFGPTSSR